MRAPNGNERQLAVYLLECVALSEAQRALCLRVVHAPLVAEDDLAEIRSLTDQNHEQIRRSFKSASHGEPRPGAIKPD